MFLFVSIADKIVVAFRLSLIRLEHKFFTQKKGWILVIDAAISYSTLLETSRTTTHTKTQRCVTASSFCVFPAYFPSCSTCLTCVRSGSDFMCCLAVNRTEDSSSTRERSSTSDSLPVLAISSLLSDSDEMDPPASSHQVCKHDAL